MSRPCIHFVVSQYQYLWIENQKQHMLKPASLEHTWTSHIYIIYPRDPNTFSEGYWRHCYVGFKGPSPFWEGAWIPGIQKSYWSSGKWCNQASGSWLYVHDMTVSKDEGSQVSIGWVGWGLRSTCFHLFLKTCGLWWFAFPFGFQGRPNQTM